MGTWTTKFRHPAIIAGVLAITLVANPALAREDSGSKRGGSGFAGGALVGAAAGGPIGAVVGATVGAIMGEHSARKNEQLARRKSEAAQLHAGGDSGSRRKLGDDREAIERHQRAFD